MAVLGGCSGNNPHQPEGESPGTASNNLSQTEIDKQYGLEGGEDGSTKIVTPLPAGRRMMTSEEWSWLTEGKKKHESQPPKEAQSVDQYMRQTLEAVAFAEGNPHAEEIGILVMLEDLPFDYTRLNPQEEAGSERDTLRKTRIGERIAQLEASQNELETAVTALGSSRHLPALAGGKRRWCQGARQGGFCCVQASTRAGGVPPETERSTPDGLQHG